MNNISAAGFVVYRKSKSDNLTFLALIALPEFQKKNNGLYDIPKGRIDPGESTLEAAIREAKEEAGLVITHLSSGPFVYNSLTVWLTESYLEPHIHVNPTTKIQEHLGYTWLTGADLYDQALDYLKPHIKWARTQLGDT